MLAIGFTIEDVGTIDFDVAMTLYLMFCASMPTFVFCYLSESFTNDLFDVGNMFFDSAWYRLPAKKQLMVAQVIQMSQRPFRLTGYKIIDCSLQVFSSVRGIENSLESNFDAL